MTFLVLSEIAKLSVLLLCPSAWHVSQSEWKCTVTARHRDNIKDFHALAAAGHFPKAKISQMWLYCAASMNKWALLEKMQSRTLLKNSVHTQHKKIPYEWINVCPSKEKINKNEATISVIQINSHQQYEAGRKCVLHSTDRYLWKGGEVKGEMSQRRVAGLDVVSRGLLGLSGAIKREKHEQASSSRPLH